MKYIATVNGQDYAVDIEPAGKPGAFTVSVDGHTHQVDLERTARGWLYSLLMDGRSFDVGASQPGGGLLVDGRGFTVEVQRDFGLQRGRGDLTAGPAALKAPIPGLVVAVHATPGDHVEAGQALVIVEAMKMQMELKSPRAGRVREVPIEPGQEVNQGQVLAVIVDS